MKQCPFCGSLERRHYAGREDACCVDCLALERHRALATQLGAELEPQGSARSLELGPRSAEVFGGFLRRRGWSYESVDRWDVRGAVDPDAFGSFIDHDADATDLAFAATAAFELFLAQHVIEELVDYPAALDEVARVLEPGGRALLEIPFDERRGCSVRQSPDQYANQWSFGTDLVGELEARFEHVVSVRVTDGEYRGVIFVCRSAVTPTPRRVLPPRVEAGRTESSASRGARSSCTAG